MAVQYIIAEAQMLCFQLIVERDDNESCRYVYCLGIINRGAIIAIVIVITLLNPQMNSSAHPHKCSCILKQYDIK